MKKGQSLVIEFILFFLISFSIFAVISSFFTRQNDFFKERVGDRLTDIVNDLVVNHIIRGIGCKSCDSFKVQGEIPSKIGGYYYEIILDQEGLNTTLRSSKIYSRESSLFNLNKTFTFQDSESRSENKIVEIQINNVNNEIEVG